MNHITWDETKWDLLWNVAVDFSVQKDTYRFSQPGTSIANIREGEARRIVSIDNDHSHRAGTRENACSTG